MPIPDYTNNKGSYEFICIASLVFRLIPVAGVAGKYPTIVHPNVSEIFFCRVHNCANSNAYCLTQVISILYHTSHEINWASFRARKCVLLGVLFS